MNAMDNKNCRMSLLIKLHKALALRNRGLVYSLLTIAVLSIMSPCGSALAQNPTGEVQWSEPVNLSNTSTSSAFPAVATDQYGNVHVFWSEDVDGELYPGDRPPNAGHAIYYTRWDGASWSPTVDVIYNANETLSYPSSTVDKDSIIHLVAGGFGGLYYSHALALSATSAHAWTEATVIAHARGDAPCLIVDTSGVLRLLYSQWEDTTDNYGDGNVYYIGSTDKGQTWSEPVQVSEEFQPETSVASNPRLVMDGRGRLHAVWTRGTAPTWFGGSVHYARSDDGGQTWSIPLEIDKQRDGYGVNAGNIVVSGDDEVHLVWMCGKLAYRCHQWSSDGGQTWISRQQLFGALNSLAGWDTLAVDADGVPYWVIQLRYPEAMYYTYWDGEAWRNPPIPFIMSGPPAMGHFPTMVVGGGNELNCVLQTQRGAEIFYVRGQTSASHALPLPTPTVTRTPLLSPTPTALVNPEQPIARATATVPVALVNNTTQLSGQGWPMVAGLVPVVLLVSIVALIGAKRRGRV